jgi:hypothetical protein
MCCHFAMIVKYMQSVTLARSAPFPAGYASPTWTFILFPVLVRMYRYRWRRYSISSFRAISSRLPQVFGFVFSPIKSGQFHWNYILRCSGIRESGSDIKQQTKIVFGRMDLNQSQSYFCLHYIYTGVSRINQSDFCLQQASYFCLQQPSQWNRPIRFLFTTNSQTESTNQVAVHNSHLESTNGESAS